MAGLLAAYVCARSWAQRGLDRRTWHGFSREALRGWGGYLKIAVPSVVMLCGKWWCFEAGGRGGSRSRAQPPPPCAGTPLRLRVTPDWRCAAPRRVQSSS